MKYSLSYTNSFLRYLKRCKKRGLDENKLWEVVGKLSNGEPLDPKHRTHKLTGKRDGQWECHIEPDWLLVWEQNDTELKLLLLNTGTHSDLF